MKRSLLCAGLMLAGCQNFGEAYDDCVQRGACTDAAAGGGSATGGGGVTGGGGGVTGGGGGLTGGGGGVTGGGAGGGTPADAGTGFSVDPPSFNFGPLALSETSVPQSIEVTNTGTQMITVGVSLTGVDSTEFSLMQNNCGGTLMPTAACTAQIRFNPTGALGMKAASVRVAALSGTVTVPVSGESIAPVTLSAASLDFLDVSVANTSQLPLTLTNNTSLMLTQTRLMQPMGTFTYDTACGTVAGHTSCPYQVTFSPTDAGVFAASLSTQVIVNGTPFSPPAVALTGNGVARGSLSFGPDPFGGVRVDAGTPLVRSFTLSNAAPTMVGPIALSLSGSGAAAFSIVDAGCTTLAPTSSCMGVLRFQPTADGTYTASLAADGGLAGFAFMSMVAQGFEAGRLQWVEDGGSVWPSTNVDVTHHFTLKNLSSGAAPPVTVSLTDAGAYGFRLEPDAGVGGCVNGVTALAPSATCAVKVTYLAGQPNTPNGVSTGLLRATAASASPAVTVLSGTAAYVFVPTGIHFGYPSSYPLIVGPPARACNFRNDGEAEVVATTPLGTQLEFRHEPSLDASRCPGQHYYEIPAKNSANYPGGIRECGGGTVFPSGEGVYNDMGNGHFFCLPTSTTGTVWGSEVTGTPIDTCRATYTRIGKIWNCQ